MPEGPQISIENSPLGSRSGSKDFGGLTVLMLLRGLLIVGGVGGSITDRSQFRVLSEKVWRSCPARSLYKKIREMESNKTQTYPLSEGIHAGQLQWNPLVLRIISCLITRGCNKLLGSYAMHTSSRGAISLIARNSIVLLVSFQ